MCKRGQITVFIILGVVLLFSIIAFISIKIFVFDKEAETEFKKSQEGVLVGNSIKNFVETCMLSTIKSAILENGISGGYFSLPIESTTDLTDNVPYYSNGYPTNEILAREIGKYVDYTLHLCLNGFEIFLDDGYEIFSDNSMSEVSLSPKKLTVKTKLPIELQKGGIIKEISDFIVDISSEEFYQNVLVSREITKNNDEIICIDCFLNLANEYDLLINVLPVNGFYVFDIEDQNYVINGENFRLRFALKYE